jgi:alpha-D-ribose 1-methylphosphonate 5-triphosphate synthase subunit PhnL
MTLASNPIVRVQNIAKGFTLHLHGGARLPVVSDVSFDVSTGECLVLGGPSGAGKSSVLKMLYGNYGTGAGHIFIHHRGADIDTVTATPQTILDIRRHTLGYVSQFLRVIPRVSAIDLIAAAAVASGEEPVAAREKAEGLLRCLNVPKSLWSLPPATFSGGEQQRINIARGFAGNHRVLILDEPTASLDAANREAFIALMTSRKADGTALIGIFHDDDMRKRVADRILDVSAYRTLEAV